MTWPFVAFGLLILYLFIGILVSCWVAYLDETDKPLIRFIIFWPLVLIYMAITGLLIDVLRGGSNMKQEFIKAVRHGKIIKQQTFPTEKGTYTINLVRYGSDIYFYKQLNEKIVEVCNLSKMSGGENGEN